MAELAQPMHAFDADLLHGDTIFVRPRAARRALPRAERRGVHARSHQPGDRRRRGRHRARRRDRRRRAAPSARRPRAWCSRAPTSRRRQHPQDLVGASSCAPTPPCASKRRRTRPTRCAAWRAPSSCCSEISPGIRLVGGVADAEGRSPRAAAHRAAARLAGAQAGPRHRRRRGAATFWSASNSASPSREPRVFSVTVPSWRATKDVSIKDDLVEEVGRMVGYDSITPQAPLVPPPCRPAIRRAQVPARGARHVRGPGLHRGLQLLVPERRGRARVRARPRGARARRQPHRLRPGADAHLAAAGHLAATSSKTPSTAKRSACSRSAWRFTSRGAGLPDEMPHLVAAVYERQGDGAAGLFEIKRAAECLMPGAEARAGRSRAPFEHPARAADLVWRGQQRGPPVRAAPVAGGTGPRGHARSGSAAWCEALGAAEMQATRPSAAIPRARSISR